MLLHKIAYAEKRKIYKDFADQAGQLQNVLNQRSPQRAKREDRRPNDKIFEEGPLRHFTKNDLRV